METPEGHIAVHVARNYVSGKMLVLLLKEVSSATAAIALYDKKIYVHKSEIQLKEDEFLVHNLVGYQVVTEDKKEIGTIISVSSFGAQENLEIKMAEGDYHALYPFIEPYIKNVDAEKRQITVLYIPEFFEDPKNG